MENLINKKLGKPRKVRAKNIHTRIKSIETMLCEGRDFFIREKWEIPYVITHCLRNNFHFHRQAIELIESIRK